MFRIVHADGIDDALRCTPLRAVMRCDVMLLRRVMRGMQGGGMVQMIPPYRTAKEYGTKDRMDI